jgi:1-acyl-sn-glycerol-3-phosphate acyltransferase
MLWKYVRAGSRCIRFGWALTVASVDFYFTVRRRGGAGNAARAAWMAKHARSVLASLGIEATSQGAPPRGGLLAANHLGYIDILVLGVRQPMIFLAKSEVRRWPILGWLAACGGTLFIRRDKKSDVARFDEAFAGVVKEGVVLGIFPEGTSSDGHRVLPFHSSLFAAAAANQWPVTPAWLGYEAEGGSVENDVCDWGDMTFFSHFRRMIALSKIKATVVYGQPIPPGLDRKQMARHLHRDVCRMAEQHRPGRMGSTEPGESQSLPASRPGDGLS